MCNDLSQWTIDDPKYAHINLANNPTNLHCIEGETNGELKKENNNELDLNLIGNSIEKTENNSKIIELLDTNVSNFLKKYKFIGYFKYEFN